MPSTSRLVLGRPLSDGQSPIIPSYLAVTLITIVEDDDAVILCQIQKEVQRPFQHRPLSLDQDDGGHSITRGAEAMVCPVHAAGSQHVLRPNRIPVMQRHELHICTIADVLQIGALTC